MKQNTFSKTLIMTLLAVVISSCYAQNSNEKTQKNSAGSTANYVDLTYASEQSVHAVVHIKTEFLKKNSIWDDFFGGSFWGDFFGSSHGNQYPVMAAGSGVLISADGYILTNNHVVEDAVKVTVTLNNKREYEAEIIGTDPDADLALIKINDQGLPYLPFANSDDVRIGEWVIAVGNPFNLTSTVTAGIVSAKARNLSILGSDNPNAIESFIQTDAAVNQGNSGGALVNVNGELVGINTAIASGLVYHTGDSVAVPSNIARKVADDLKNYRSVQRAYLGVAVIELDGKKADELQLDEAKGLLVAAISESSAAANGDLREGDVILSLNNQEVNTLSEMRGVLYQYSPGDKVTLQVLRGKEILTKEVELYNHKGNTEIVKNPEEEVLQSLGAAFENLTSQELKFYRIKGGVKVTKIYPGLFSESGIEPGFVITSINGTTIYNIDELNKFFKYNKRQYISLEGVYDDGYYRYTYTIQLQ